MHEKQGKYVFFSHTGINLQQIQKDNTATTKVKNKSIEMGEVLRQKKFVKRSKTVKSR